MKSEEDNDIQQQYDIIIVQCCENCESHQALARHSQWKYFQQFNQFKRKIERFINNTIVIKNPVPDQLIKNPDDKLNKNAYINKQTKEPIIFPRIGAFEIYIYNVLIYSKLISNNWPNHYKLIQLITKIIEAKNKGQSLEEYSVYKFNEEELEKPQKIEKVKPVAAVSKKKKKDYRVYKSKDKTIPETSLKKNLEPVTARKPGRRTLLDREKEANESANVSRNLQTKNDNRVKLPSLRNTINFREESEEEFQQKKPVINKRYSVDEADDKSKNTGTKKIFNSIEEFQKEEISFISNKQQSVEDMRYNSLIFDQNESIDANSIKQENEIKIMENRSVQYSEREDGKDFMNRSIQYEEQEGYHCDFAIQIDDGNLPRQINLQFVQTDPVTFEEQPKQQIKKPYMLDEQVEANIQIQIPQASQLIQTISPAFQSTETNTEMKITINRMQQFPEPDQIKAPVGQFSFIDDGFKHLYEKRRNIVDNGEEFYSVDRFEENATKYKWIGRAKLKESPDQIRRKTLLESLVFCVYDYFGVKVVEKRLSFQTCTNILITNEKDRKNQQNALIHILTPFNPQIQYPFQFQQYSHQQKKYPLSEQLTFKNSKQKVKFENYSLLLAIAYYLGDKQLFTENKNNLGFVVSNEEVKEIYKLNADEFVISKEIKNSEYRAIAINSEDKFNSIAIDRLTQYLQLQFISVINKISNKQIFEELLKVIEETFIRMSPAHKKFRNTLLSMKTEKVDEDLVNEFIQMLKARRAYLIEQFKGEIYAYQNYGVLKPEIMFSLDNYKKIQELNMETGYRGRISKNKKMVIERRLMFNDKQVSQSDIEKHLRNKDNFVIVTGQSGSGKSQFMEGMCQIFQQKYSDKIRVTRFPINIFEPAHDMKLKKMIDTILDDYKKQIICLEDAENYFMQVISLVTKLYSKDDPRTKPDMSFFITTNDLKNQSSKFKNRLLALNLQVTACNLLPLETEQIRAYLTKEIKYHNVTDKKNLLQEILGAENVPFNQAHSKYNNIIFLRVPFFLNLYTQFLCHVQDLGDFRSCLVTSLNRYSLFKQIHLIAKQRQISEISNMKIKVFDVYHDIKRLAFEYYHNNFQINETIKEIFHKNNQEVEIITNQLAFYPLNLGAFTDSSKFLFVHMEYLHFYLCEAYTFFLQNSYRNLQMQRVYSNQNLMKLLKQHYQVERTYSRLLDVIENSKKYKNTGEQASVAITTMNKLDYLFSNLNFDDVQIPDADLSKSVFYHTSFRNANLKNATLYKSHLLSCQLQGTQMENISMYCRKYQIEYTVLSASMSVDGRNLALGCGNFLIILNTQTGKQIKRIEAHLDIIRTVRYSKDNMGLVTIADDKTLRVWDTRNYKSVVFRLPQKGLIVFNYETQNIAVVSKSVVKLWNIKSMASELILEGHKDFVSCVEFGGNGKYVVTGSRDTMVRLWDSNTGESLKVYKGHTSEVIVGKLAPNKKMVGASSKDKQFILWETDSRSEILKKKFDDEIIEFVMDDKDKYIILAFAKDNDILVANLNTLDPIYYLQGHKARILSITYDAFYRRLVSLSKDKTVRIWDVDKIMEIQQKIFNESNNYRLKASPNSILSIAFCKLSLQYAIGHDNGEINIYSSIDNRLKDQIFSHNGPITCLAYDRSGKLYSAGSDGSVRIWNLKVRRQPRTIDVHSSEVLQLKLNEKYRIIATSSATNQLVIYDFTGIKLVMSTREQGRVQAIEFSRDEKIMAVGGTQRYIALYQISDGGSGTNRLEELGPNDESIITMLFHEDAYLVVALKNGNVAIWNYLKASIVKKIENLSPINSILSFQRKFICLVSMDGKIRIVNMEEGKEAKTFKYPENPTSVVVNTSETIMYVATKQGNVIGWNLNALKPKKDKVIFGRLAFDDDGNKLVQIESGKQLLIRDLHYHTEEVSRINSLQSDIEGVTFYKNEIVLLLRDGSHWDVSKNKEYKFEDDREVEGELFWVKQKLRSNFYRTPVRKIKNIKLPVQAILDQLFSS